MSEVTLKPKVTLRRKGDTAAFTFNEKLKVELVWATDTDLDLCLFFKTKDGTLGGVFSDGYRQNKNDLGSLSKFPFILHSGDEKEPREGGESNEEIKIANLDGISEAYICIVNYDKAIDNEPVTFSEDTGRVEVTSDTGDNLEINANSDTPGHVYLVCSIKVDGTSKSVKNESEVMSLGDAFNKIPGFSLICN
jgi:uncharacterized protein involved in tellurium resistance